MELNKNQISFITDESEFIRLLAPAGSGKTFSILKKCEHIHTANENDKIQIFTFTRVARNEIRSRIDNPDFFNGKQANVGVNTLNQFGYKVIKKLQNRLQLKISKKDKYYLVESNLRPIWNQDKKLEKILEIQPKIYSDLIDVFNNLKSIGFQHKFKEKQELHSNFQSHWKWLKENGLGRYFEDNIERPLKEMELVKAPIEWKRLLRFWSKSVDQLWQSKIISFADQKYWAYLKLKEEEELKSSNIKYIIVDEFQDINPLDLNLLLEIRRINNSSLILVGDDDQAIFEWRGSSPKFILKPKKYTQFSFKEHLFEYNYRSPSKLIEVSQNLIKHNSQRVNKTVESKKEGTIDVIVSNYHSPSEYLEDLLDYCVEAAQSNKPNELAIISRKRAQLIPIQILLTSKEINYYAKEDLNVLLSMAFEDLRKVLEILATKEDRKSASAIVDDLIHLVNLVYKYPLKYKNKLQLKDYLLANDLKTLQGSIDLIRSYDQPLKTSNSDRRDSDKVYGILNKILYTDSVSRSIQFIGENFEGLKQHYKKAEDDIFYSDPPFIFLADYAERYEDNYWDFIDHVEKSITKMKSRIPEDEKDEDYYSSIHLMTALRAKGKEFKKVIILDVNEGIWPIKQAETQEQLEQERRIFYVGITRAMEHLNLITTDRYLNNRMKKSRYINEMKIGSS